MSRLLITLVVIIALVIGALFALRARSGERPLTHVEKVVSLGDLKK